MAFQKRGGMRRKDKQINDPHELVSIIRSATVCRIGFSRNDVPYIVPVNYGYQDNCLYFHSAPEGRKIDIIRQNNRVCFEMETDVEVVESESPCKWSTKYRSVIGYGKAAFVEDSEQKKMAMDIIVAHYGAAKHDYPVNQIGKLAIIRIEIESMTGKTSGF